MILAIKTADFTTTLSLLDVQGHEQRSVSWESGRELSSQLLTSIEELLKAANAKLSDLTGILIYSGPGSFTSLRIGHSVANALADSLGVPVSGTSGVHWQAEGLITLKRAEPGRPALPEYGAEAHITKPRT